LKVPEIGILQGNDVVQIANARLECLCELLFNQSFSYILSVLQTTVEKLPMSLNLTGMTDAYIANPLLGTYVVALQLPSNRRTVKATMHKQEFCYR